MFGGGDFTYEDFLQWAKQFGEKEEEFIRVAGIANDADARALTGTDARNMLLSNSRGFCELRSSMGQKVYYYIFDHDIPGDDAGSFHGSDRSLQ